MGIGLRVGRRPAKRAVFVIVPILAVSLVLGAHWSQAADMRIVTGLVKSVSGTEIEVKGRTYDIAGVPIRNAAGRPVPLAELSAGTKVDLYFSAGKLRLVHVYANVGS